MWEIKNTAKLLRFPFSLFLLPVTLFSFYFIHPGVNFQSILLIFIWHALVFPASNGYNSYNDRDESPIGALAAPPKPTRQLLYAANIMDLSAIALSFFITPAFAVFVAVYILASRLYSNRSIRLKKYPVIGFLVVFIFQGAWIFTGNIFALSQPALLLNNAVILSAVASSFFIGTVYPITQIYQHEADKKDGVTTLSMVLGLRGTFIFSAAMFFVATLLMYLSAQHLNLPGNFLLFNIIMLASTIYFFSWAYRSFRNPTHVNFKNVMIMLILSAMSNNIYFVILLNR